MLGDNPGLTVSRIALGCGSFGRVGSAPEFFGQGLTEDQALTRMDAAWESGIRWFDTADAYGGGRSEQAIGRWMAARGVRPRLTTKTFNPMESGADHGLKPDRVARQLRSSLDRLGVDHVYLYLAQLERPGRAAGENLQGVQRRPAARTGWSRSTTASRSPRAVSTRSRTTQPSWRPIWGAIRRIWRTRNERPPRGRPPRRTRCC